MILLIAYIATSLVLGTWFTRLLYNRDDWANDQEDQYFTTILGLFLGSIWPLTLLVMAFKRIAFGPSAKEK